MKKGLIAGAAATAALAAMPMAGVFAANVTDTVQLTVDTACTMTSTGNGITVDLGNTAPGNALTAQNGTVMTVTCNNAKGWTLTAAAESLSFTDATRPIPFGAYAETSSVWSAKVALGTAGAATIATGWDNFAGANGTIVSGAAGSAVSGLTITPSYKAYVDAAQPAGTYSGTIAYTFAQNQ